MTPPESPQPAPPARPADGAASALRPLRHPAFATMWTASLVSNIGTWMQQMGAAWLMTTLSASPLLVSLVMTANTLPLLLFALAAGALADIFDRRRLLLIAQTAMAAAAIGLAVLVQLGLATPWLLLAFTFALGVGAALTAPAWQAVVPHLVPKEDLRAAVSLNSAGFNAARAVGPALAGVLVSWAGLASPFFANGVSFLAVIAALLFWRGARRPASSLPSERLFDAIGAGLRYARSSAPLRSTLIRTAAFFSFASAYWALMPVLVRNQLGGDAGQYGLVLGAVGFGAVASAGGAAWAQNRLGADRLVLAGSLVTAVALGLFAASTALPMAMAAGLIAGAGWLAVVASVNASTQMAVPEWLRGRGLAMFQTTLFGSMALSTIGWGRLADGVGVRATLLAAAAGLVVTAFAARRFPLAADDPDALRLAPPWPEPALAQPVDHDRGPVMVTIEYRVAVEDADRFAVAIEAMGASRRRSGAYAWGAFQDAAEPECYVECFYVPSWLAHLRQHERVTAADSAQRQALFALHRGDAPPRVRHWLAPEEALRPAGGG